MFFLFKCSFEGINKIPLNDTIKTEKEKSSNYLIESLCVIGFGGVVIFFYKLSGSHKIYESTFTKLKKNKDTIHEKRIKSNNEEYVFSEKILERRAYNKKSTFSRLLEEKPVIADEIFNIIEKEFKLNFLNIFGNKNNLYDKLFLFFDNELWQLITPIMPFIYKALIKEGKIKKTEEIYQKLFKVVHNIILIILERQKPNLNLQENTKKTIDFIILKLKQSNSFSNILTGDKIDLKLLSQYLNPEKKEQ